MNKQLDRLILVDCDGVLLNWEYAFNTWMQANGYTISEDPVNKYSYDMKERYELSSDVAVSLVKHFNESAAMGFLPPQRDAIQYVRKLHEELGYVFHVITSLSKNPYACELRKMNLRKMFGETVFDGFTFLDTAQDKNRCFEPWKDSGLFWIEDKTENAISGRNWGLSPILIEHGHNMFVDCDKEHITMVKNWKEIYELLK